MGKIKYKSIKNISSMRKLALGAWGDPTDPSVNVELELDITRLNVDQKEFKPLFIKIISKVMNDHPELNRILIRKKFRQRLDNRIFIPTVIKSLKSYDLSGISIDDAFKKNNSELEHEWKQKIANLRTGKNKEINRARKIYHWMPSIFLKQITKLLSFCHYSLNIPISFLGLPDDPFGAVTITFLDKFNIKYAHVPIYAFSRSAITISVGRSYNDKDLRILPLTCTFDHRYFDGMEGGKAYKSLEKYCKNPELI